MKTTLLRARQMSLALLVVAVIDNGHLHVDASGATPSSWGLVRLGRDLLRRAGARRNPSPETVSHQPRSLERGDPSP